MAVIRRAGPGDLLRLEAIEQLSFPTPHWAADNFLAYECYVAEVDGRVAGFLIARVVFEEYRGARAEREILNLAVDPSYRRLGIASALLQHELSQPATHFLEVRESNIPAQRLYKGLGFAEIGRRQDYYSSPTESAIVMQMK